MKLSDLTPAELRQVRTGRADTSARGASPLQREKGRLDKSTARGQGGPPREPIWGCHDCDELFAELAPAQRHCDTESHRRLDWLPGRKEQP